MKQSKIYYEKCRKKLPHRPPNEIDFGLGFRAALEWALTHKADIINTKFIKKELQ